MAETSAARSLRYRQRQRQGLEVFPLGIDRRRWRQLLERDGRLEPDDGDAEFVCELENLLSDVLAILKARRRDGT